MFNKPHTDDIFGYKHQKLHIANTIICLLKDFETGKEQHFINLLTNWCINSSQEGLFNRINPLLKGWVRMSTQEYAPQSSYQLYHWLRLIDIFPCIHITFCRATPTTSSSDHQNWQHCDQLSMWLMAGSWLMETIFLGISLEPPLLRWRPTYWTTVWGPV